MKAFILIGLLNLSFFSKAQSITNLDTSSYYSFNAKLLKAVRTPDCGVVAWEVAQKFRIISSNYSKFIRKGVFILLCPELHGRDFLIEGETYNLKVQKNSLSKLTLGAHNIFEDEKLPTFWISEINKLN